MVCKNVRVDGIPAMIFFDKELFVALAGCGFLKREILLDYDDRNSLISNDGHF